MNDCPTHLLTDSPATKDAFGSHERVAKAIASLVANEQGGRSIALTGSWGSGKSTVVRLLRESLVRKTDSQVEVFVFDAWSHQGDPLRRSFLERLIDFLSERKWIDQTKWSEEKAKLSKRLKISETHQIPRLTPGGIALTIGALLVPIGLALISKFQQVPYWVPIVGCVLAAAPLFVFLFMLLTGFGAGKESNGAQDAHQAAKRQDILRLLVTRTNTYTRNETHETPEPTSVEFQRIFAQMMFEALDARRTLLIVIDNLDRIDSKDALAIWSTMRTFFEPDCSPDAQWRSRFWLLVPVDPSALVKLWHEDDCVKLPDAFVDKTFQVKFRISPPVLSGWKTFFISQFREALPQHAIQNDVYSVYRLYRWEGLEPASPVTPRQIKLFINELGALHRQWCGQVPLVYQALYVLSRDRFEEAPEAFLGEDFLSPRVRPLLPDDDWRPYLAALHYNVPPKAAMEVVLGTVLDQTLAKGEVGHLKEYHDVPGLSTHIDHYLEENHSEWADKDPSTLARAAMVLDEIASTGADWGEAWRWLDEGARRVTRWANLDEQLASAISLIVKRTPHCDLQGLAPAIINAACADPKMTEVDPTSQPDTITVNTWVDGSLLLLRLFQDLKAGIELLAVPGSAVTYCAVIRRLTEKSGIDDLLTLFRPQAALSAVVEELVRVCRDGQYSQLHALSVEIMIKTNANWGWNPLCSALNDRLQAQNALQPDELYACLRSLLILEFRGSAVEVEQMLHNLCKKGHIMHHLHGVQSDPNIAALCIFTWLLEMPQDNIQSKPGNANAGHEFFHKVLSNPEISPELGERISAISVEFQKFSLPLDMCRDLPQSESLASVIFRNTIRRADAASFIDSEFFLAEYSTIDLLLDDESLDLLIRTLVRTSSLCARILQKEFYIKYERLYLSAYKQSAGTERESLTEEFVRGFGTLGKSEWLPQLHKEGPLLQVLVLILEHKAKCGLRQGFHDALDEHANHVICEGVMPKKLIEKWGFLTSALDSNWRSTFASTLWDGITRNSSKTLSNVLLLYGEFLQSSDIPTSCDSVVRHVLSDIVGRDESVETSWLADLLETRKEVFTGARAQTREAFRDRVRERIAQVSDSAMRLTLERIARAVRVQERPIRSKHEETTS